LSASRCAAFGYRLRGPIPIIAAEEQAISRSVVTQTLLAVLFSALRQFCGKLD
jgi:hypothetical protein